MSTKDSLLTPPAREDETASPTASAPSRDTEGPDIDYAAIRSATEAMSALGRSDAQQDEHQPEAESPAEATAETPDESPADAPAAGDDALEAPGHDAAATPDPHAVQDSTTETAPEDSKPPTSSDAVTTETEEAIDPSLSDDTAAADEAEHDADHADHPDRADRADHDDSDDRTAPAAEDTAGTDVPAAAAASAAVPADGNGGSEPPVPPADETAQEDDAEKPMGLLDHLNEMRWRLVRCFIAAALGFCVCWAFVEPIFGVLVKPLLAALPAGGNAIYTSMPEAFFIRMFVAFVAGLFVASPFIFYQVWAFISPGLYEEEKLFIVPVAVISAVFFVGGALFCYYIVFPFAFQFFMSYSTDMIQVTPRISDYVDFVLKLLVAFGVIFEKPLFSFFLARMGVLTAARMRQARRYAILGIFIVAAILTPPDVVSQLLMAIPMLILYEFSVLVAATFGKKPKPAAEAEDTPEPAASSEPEPWPSVFTPSNPKKVSRMPDGTWNDVPAAAETPDTPADDSPDTAPADKRTPDGDAGTPDTSRSEKPHD